LPLLFAEAPAFAHMALLVKPFERPILPAGFALATVDLTT
jgi:hypothetical protein